MIVEFLRQHYHIPPGRVLDLAGGVADVLVKRGVARPVAQPEPVAEAPAAVAPPEPVATAPTPPKPAKKAK